MRARGPRRALQAAIGMPLGGVTTDAATGGGSREIRGARLRPRVARSSRASSLQSGRTRRQRAGGGNIPADAAASSEPEHASGACGSDSTLHDNVPEPLGVLQANKVNELREARFARASLPLRNECSRHTHPLCYSRLVETSALTGKQ